MGVTLERVQNKFACIIGELCNEPYVLSQFAIWVDLRIAEYKANGAISLDCTGDNPHPTWLKGMNPPKSTTPNQSLNQSGSSRRHGRFDSLGNPTSATESCGLSFDSGEYEIVEVKEEPPDFPTCTSFKSHGRLSPTRKRISENQDFLESDNSVFPTSAPKSRRLSAASEYTGISTVGQDTVSNQSFMSVIGLTDHTAHSVDNLNLPSDEKSPFSKFDQSKGSNQGNVSFDDVTIHPSVSTDEDTMTHNHRQTMATPRFPGMQVYKFSHGILSQSPKAPSRCPGRQPVSSISETTAINTQSAVSIFERWLIVNYPDVVNKFKCIEGLPFADLDEYLSKFWPSIKKQNGTDYQVQSLIQLRTRLDRHLRRKGYPLSIVKSDQFSKSQRALKARLTNSHLKLTGYTPVIGPTSPPVSRGTGNTGSSVVTGHTPFQDAGVDLRKPFEQGRQRTT